MSLHQRAILVDLTRSKYDNLIKDTEGRQQILNKHNCKITTAVSAKKRLFLDGCLKPLNSLMTKVYMYHLSVTLPWDAQYRLLPKNQLLKYKAEIQTHKDQLPMLLDKIADQFEEHKKKDVELATTLNHESDYPTMQELRGKYDIRIDFAPVPAQGDFRVDLTPGEIKLLEYSMFKKQEEALDIAKKEWYDKLAKPIAHLIEKLLETDTRLHESLIGNIEKITGILPDLNVEEDPSLDLVLNEVKEKLLVYKISDVKTDEQTKLEVIQKANEILSQIKGKATKTVYV